MKRTRSASCEPGQPDAALERWLDRTVVRDAAGHPLLLEHHTKAQFDTLDPNRTVDGGLHFGTPDQAAMRAGKGARAIRAYLKAENIRRCRDRGGNWKPLIESAKRAGMDAIVYLNRYEGLTTEVIERLSASGDLSRLDGMTDAQFRKAVPEARDSYIAFSPEQLWIEERPTDPAAAHDDQGAGGPAY